MIQLSMECGPEWDRRVFEFSLPAPSQPRLGVFVSGGLDSALLYWIVASTARVLGQHRVQALTVLRNEGSRHHAFPVINYIHAQLGLPRTQLLTVGDSTLEEPEQVRSGVRQVLGLTHARQTVDVAYVGVIQAQPEHTVGWQSIPATPAANFKTPLSGLTKCHIVDMIFQLGLQQLFLLTHSCIHPHGRCGQCNGCRERAWAFEQCQRSDPGIS